MRIQRLSAEMAAAEMIPEDADLSNADPVEIAALLLQRARADLAELRGHYHRLDLFVLLFALVIILVAGRIYDRLVTPPSVGFSERGLTFQRSQGWMQPEPVSPFSPRLLRRTDSPPATPRREQPYHVAFTFANDASGAPRGVDRAQAGVEQHRHRPRPRPPHPLGRAVQPAEQQHALDRRPRLAAHLVPLRARRRQGATRRASTAPSSTPPLAAIAST